MKFSRRKILWSIIIVIIIGFVSFFYTFYKIKAVNGDLCLSAVDKYTCYIDKVHAVLQAQGINAAMQYADEVMRKYSVFGYTHMVMHTVGRDAYSKTHDLKKALSYGLSTVHQHDFFFHDDGYSHGVFQAYFEEQKYLKTKDELIKDVCGTYLDDAPPAGNSERWLSFRECFHGVGHALMYANNNNVIQSLSDCDTLAYPIQLQWCYYGVFMENSYLYIPGYKAHRPGIFTNKDSMISLCTKIDRRYRAQCANFVGRAYAQAAGEIEGAFQQCFLLEEDFREGCIEHTAWLFIPAFFRYDFSKMIATCNSIGEKYKSVCIRAVAVGIARGTGGKIGQKEIFCNLVEKSLYHACLDAMQQRLLLSDTP